MKKYLGWFAVPFLLSILVNFVHEHYSYKAASDGRDKCLFISLECTPDSKDYSPDPNDNAAVWWERGYVFLGWPNGTTIWALVITFAVIADQTAETRRSASATEEAAAASLKQVEHMVNAERPFMMIEARDAGFGGYQFWAVNCGKSPAQLVFINRVPVLVVHKHGEPYPDKPWYGFGFYEPEITVFNEPWIAPGKEILIGTLDREVVEIRWDVEIGLDTGESELLAYGAIKYRGRFSEAVWHSKYCYRKMPFGMSMAGGYGWNDYT